jgi:hypothetical protein
MDVLPLLLLGLSRHSCPGYFLLYVAYFYRFYL